ncbi:MAG: glycosyltransferase, partial [Propionibacteriaceae bacterium]|nr:glycosyltransferase [Propionibacteriaceae bacterium]
MSTHHLLVVANQFDETVGGLEIHLQELLPRLVDRGLCVTLVYLGSQSPREWRGVEVVPMRRRLDFRAIMALPDPRDVGPLWRRLRAGGLAAGPVTIMATHTRFFPMSWLGLRWARRLGVPLLHTEHGGGPVATRPRLVAELSNAVDRTLGRAVLRGADRVLAVSRAGAAFVEDLAGFEPHILGNGIRLQDWLPDDPTAPLPAERPLVFAGRFIREKGWADFL